MLHGKAEVDRVRDDFVLARVLLFSRYLVQKVEQLSDSVDELQELAEEADEKRGEADEHVEDTLKDLQDLSADLVIERGVIAQQAAELESLRQKVQQQQADELRERSLLREAEFRSERIREELAESRQSHRDAALQAAEETNRVNGELDISN